MAACRKSEVRYLMFVIICPRKADYSGPEKPDMQGNARVAVFFGMPTEMTRPGTRNDDC